jgi:ABC-2 type transport system ATP-binding protein
VGAMLEAGSFHPGRSARAHLGALAVSNAIPLGRVEEVLALVGLEAAGRRRDRRRPPARRGAPPGADAGDR